MNIPEGWKLVPVELTEEMQVAGIFAASQMRDVSGLEMLNEKRRAIYRSQLAAAPTTTASVAWPPECEELCKAAEGMQRAINELWKAEYPEELDEDQEYMDIDEARQLHTGAWNALHSAIHYMRKRMSASSITTTPPAQENDVNTCTLSPVVAHETGNVNDKQETEPMAYLLNGTRFKMSFSGSGKVFCFANYRTQLDGRWVALVAAEDDIHLRPSAAPDKLRKAAEEALKLLDKLGSGPTIENLRAALEGK